LLSKNKKIIETNILTKFNTPIDNLPIKEKLVAAFLSGGLLSVLP
jgi:hypothetical protein